MYIKYKEAQYVQSRKGGWERRGRIRMKEVGTWGGNKEKGMPKKIHAPSHLTIIYH